jgi:DNA-binding transcriptional regulator GbsR (MarR family)
MAVQSKDSEAAKSQSLNEFEQGVIDIFVRLADMLSVPRSIAEIYGLLFASARPLSFQDIVDRLGISKGSASQGLRVLRATGAAKLVYVPADRRDYFVPETELRALLSGFLREKIQPHLEGGAVRVEALRKMAPVCAKEPTEAAVLRERVEKLTAWHKRGKSIVPIITKVFG